MRAPRILRQCLALALVLACASTALALLPGWGAGKHFQAKVPDVRGVDDTTQGREVSARDTETEEVVGDVAGRSGGGRSGKCTSLRMNRWTELNGYRPAELIHGQAAYVNFEYCTSGKNTTLAYSVSDGSWDIGANYGSVTWQRKSRRSGAEIKAEVRCELDWFSEETSKTRCPTASADIKLEDMSCRAYNMTETCSEAKQCGWCADEQICRDKSDWVMEFYCPEEFHLDLSFLGIIFGSFAVAGSLAAICIAASAKADRRAALRRQPSLSVRDGLVSHLSADDVQPPQLQCTSLSATDGRVPEAAVHSDTRVVEVASLSANDGHVKGPDVYAQSKREVNGVGYILQGAVATYGHAAVSQSSAGSPTRTNATSPDASPRVVVAPPAYDSDEEYSAPDFHVTILPSRIADEDEDVDENANVGASVVDGEKNPAGGETTLHTQPLLAPASLAPAGADRGASPGQRGAPSPRRRAASRSPQRRAPRRNPSPRRRSGSRARRSRSPRGQASLVDPLVAVVGLGPAIVENVLNLDLSRVAPTRQAQDFFGIPRARPGSGLF